MARALEVGPRIEESNIPKGQQWSDLVEKDCVVMVQQPEGQRCAVVGGIHALRIKRRGGVGLVVEGRVRDRAEMEELGMPVWARGTSIVGAGAECKAWAVQVPLRMNGLEIHPGDVLFCDPEEGAVRIPKALLQQVLDWMKAKAPGEAKIKKMVSAGSTVAEAFKACR
jgi:regulator of RNase E activity RraA